MDKAHRGGCFPWTTCLTTGLTFIHTSAVTEGLNSLSFNKVLETVTSEVSAKEAAYLNFDLDTQSCFEAT